MAMLETAFVSITLEQSRACGIPPVSNVGRSANKRTATSAIPPMVHQKVGNSWTKWTSLSGSLARIPMLKSCPHFLRGRLRQCWAVALRNRHRARQVHDNSAEKPVDVVASTTRIWMPGDIGLHFSAMCAAVLSRCVAELPRARPRGCGGQAALSRVQQGQVFEGTSRAQVRGMDIPRT